MQDIFFVLTDTDHKSGFKLQSLLLARMFQLVETNQITVPLYDPATVPDTSVSNADFLRDFDVGTVDGTEQQTTVETELHVRRTGRLRSGGGDVLADVGRGNEDLSEGYGVVGEEVKAEKVLGVGVVVDDACDVDDQADSL